MSARACGGRPTTAAIVSACLLVAAPAAAAPATATAAPRPNVLVINTDDQRAAGTMQVLPQTRAWLQRGGTRFTRAHATTPLCCPSRVSFFTGLYAHNHGVHKNFGGPQIRQRATVQRHLRRAGYRTGIVGKFVNNFPIERRPRFWDYAKVTEGGYRDTRWNLNGRVRRVQRYSTRFIAEQASRFVRGAERRDRRPWFLYVAPSAPHGPLEPERRFADAPVGRFATTPATAERDLSDKPPFLRRLIRSVEPSASYRAEVTGRPAAAADVGRRDGLAPAAAARARR